MAAVRQFVYERERVKRQPPPQRAKALAFIRSEIEAGRRFPTREAIAAHMGWRYASSVVDVLRSLSGDGHLRLAGRVPNNGSGGSKMVWELVP